MTLHLSESPPADDVAPPPHRHRPPHDHAVRFYEGDAFLAATVADFLWEGYEAGEPLLVVATEAHRREIAERLAERGCDVDDPSRVLLLDARATLERLMRGAMPDPDRVHAVLGPLIEELAARSPGGVRAFGEMVDLLWKDGKTEAAVRQIDGVFDAYRVTQ